MCMTRSSALVHAGVQVNERVFNASSGREWFHYMGETPGTNAR